MKIELEQPAKNQAIVTVGKVELFFSYRACIAVRAYGGPEYVKLFNPDYRGYSPTTSRHATQLGCSGFPDAASGAEFQAAVSAALQTAWAE